MNGPEVEDAAERFARHPVLGPATRTLLNLMEYANANSDGWCYWPKPARAAAQLMALIERDAEGRNRRLYGASQNATANEYKRALRAVRAFRTRQGADFEICEV